MSRRSFVTRDQRTSQKISADRLVMDGQNRNLFVSAGTADPLHPLQRPKLSGKDFVGRGAAGPYRERQSGPTIIPVGYAGQGATFTRPGIDTIGYAATDAEGVES